MHKKIFAIFFIVIILCCTVICPVYAKPKHEITTDNLDKWHKEGTLLDSVHNTEEYKDFPFTVQKAIDMYLDVCTGASSSSVSEIKNIVLFSPSDAGNDSTTKGKRSVWDLAKTYYESFKSIGFMFCCLYFLIDLIDKTTREQLNPEHFIRQFIKLMLAILIISNGILVAEKFFAFTTALVDKIGDAGKDVPIDFIMIDSVAKYANEKGWIFGFLVGLGEMTTLLVPWLASLIAKGIIIIQCWSRFIEIGIRITFAPIGMADMFSDGLHGSGFRYLKKLISLFIQGAMIIAIVTLCQGIQGAMSVSSSVFFQISQIVVAFTEVGLIKKSQVFANDLLGVH